MIMLQESQKNLVCVLALLNGKDFANPKSFGGCPAGVPGYLKLFEWSLIEHIFLSFLLSSSSPPPRIYSSKYYSPFLLFFSSPLKEISSLSFSFFSPPHLHHISPPTTYISFSFFVILLLCKQINVWIKLRNCVGHFVLFMQYVVKCTMSWFTHSIRKFFV